MKNRPGSAQKTKIILTMWAALALGSPHVRAFTEDWEQTSPGSYSPTAGPPTLIQGDAGTWLLDATVSGDPDCGPAKNSAEVIPWDGGQALRLNSIDSDSGCSDNIFLSIQAAPQLGVNQNFTIPLGRETTLSFEESGSLNEPAYFPEHSNCVDPPCYDAVTLYVQDNHLNTLAYVLQRAEQAVPQSRAGFYREIFLDRSGGRYSRNLYEDFITLANFQPQGAEITFIQLNVDEHGNAVFDKLSITGGPAPPVDAVDTRKCSASQLQAAGKLCQAALKCRSQYVRKAAADPNEVGITACRDRAQRRFATAYNRAIAKVGAVGNACALNDPADGISAELLGMLDPISTGLETGWMPSSRADSRLRAKLLSATGTLCAESFRAEAIQARRPNAKKLVRAHARAERKFLATTRKALSKAGKVHYAGAPPSAVLEQTESLVGKHVEKYRLNP